MPLKGIDLKEERKNNDNKIMLAAIGQSLGFNSSNFFCHHLYKRKGKQRMEMKNRNQASNRAAPTVVPNAIVSTST